MGGEAELVKAGVEALLAPVRDIYEKLAGPALTEIGQTFGDAARVYRLKITAKLLKRVREITQEAGIQPRAVPLKLLLPILGHASLEDDEDLQERWAALLTNAADPNSATAVQPAFPEILNQLSARDVKFVSAIYDSFVDSIREPAEGPKFVIPPRLTPPMLIGTIDTLFTKYKKLGLSAPLLNTSGPPGEDPEVFTKWAAGENEFRIVLTNLQRLGLITQQLIPDKPLVGFKAPAFASDPPLERVFSDLRTAFAAPGVPFFFTPLGYEFVTACRRPAPKSA